MGTKKRLHPVDWQVITNNIRHHYKPLAAVAQEVGCDWRHIGRLSRGEVSEPRYTVGINLLAMHQHHCPAQHAANQFKWGLK